MIYGIWQVPVLLIRCDIYNTSSSFRRLLRLDFVFVVRQTLIFLCEVPDKGIGGQTDVMNGLKHI